MPAEVGAPAPDFTLFDQHWNRTSLASLRGHKSAIVFIPYPFTRVCSSELCAIRDTLGAFEEADAKVLAVTVDNANTNAAWARAEHVEYPILADFWPHGAVSMSYGCFNDELGVANRASYLLDRDLVVREIVTSDFGSAREFDRHAEALRSL